MGSADWKPVDACEEGIRLYFRGFRNVLGYGASVVGVWRFPYVVDIRMVVGMFQKQQPLRRQTSWRHLPLQGRLIKKRCFTTHGYAIPIAHIPLCIVPDRTAQKIARSKP